MAHYFQRVAVLSPAAGPLFITVASPSPEAASLPPWGHHRRPAPLAERSARLLQDGCEFLVAQTPDGRMDLRDVYVLDQDGGVYARPVTTGEMPQEPQLYVAVPWREEFLGDMSHNKDPWTKARF